MGKDLKILLAEDNEVNQHLTLRILERFYYRADLARNGAEALEKELVEHYDVILMDIQMPEMDGLTATRMIRQQVPQNLQPRIIALTAESSVHEKEKYLSGGMDGHLSKPIQVDELLEILEGLSRIENESKIETQEKIEVDNGEMAKKKSHEHQAMDYQVLREFQAMMGEEGHQAVIQLKTLYIKDAPIQWDAMVRSMKASDFDALRRAAHTLKGNSQQVGALSLAEQCELLEKASREYNREESMIYLKTIKDEIKEVLTELSQFNPE